MKKSISSEYKWNIFDLKTKTNKFPESFMISCCISFKEPVEKTIITSTINWPNQPGLQNTLTAFRQRGKTPPPQQVTKLRHRTIWWWSFSNAGDLRNVEYSFIVIAPRSTLIRCSSTWYGPIYGSNRTKLCNYTKLNCLKLTVFTFNSVFKLCNYSKLNSLK